MIIDLKTAVVVIQKLHDAGVEPLLYGSLGASLYLGKFKDFGDIDLLVDSVWVSEKWLELQLIMSNIGFSLQDEHEHEFENNTGLKVAFAEDAVLTRDGVVLNAADDIIIRQVHNVEFKTLAAEAFLRAYQFSVKDGYRLENRGKKDAEIVDLFQQYLQKNQV